MEKIMARIAVVIATAALLVAVYAALRPRTEVDITVIEEQVYRNIVTEVARELAPVYESFGVEFEREPETISELTRPLVSVRGDLTPKPSDDSD